MEPLSASHQIYLRGFALCDVAIQITSFCCRPAATPKGRRLCGRKTTAREQ
eukprot:SAG11_NODE_1355_length_5124_cov_17.930348_6_plen_51_part_00